MSDRIGQYTPAELAARLDALDAAVQASRRELLRELLPRIEELAALIAHERGLDEAALDEAKARYRKQFGLLARINPFSEEARRMRETRIAPAAEEVSDDRELEQRCVELLEHTRAAAGEVEVRTNWHGGIAGVYDPVRGQVEWREKWHHGIAGVWNPVARAIEWNEAWKHGVAGVWNPVAGAVEWKKRWHGGVAGAWNPETREIEWREKWHHGVAGVWNPVARAVEWRTAWKAGVAGRFDAATASVEWIEQRHAGVACVWFDGATYQTSQSFYGDGDET